MRSLRPLSAKLPWLPSISRGRAAILGLTVLAAGCATEPEPPRAVSVAVSPGAATLTFLGQSAGFTATVTDQYGDAFAGTVAWTSDAPAVFSVNSAGLVTAVSNGTGTVRATLGGVNGIATVAVSQTATTLERVGGDAQRGNPGTPLSEPLVALVLDGGDNPVAGAAVSFTPAAGSGIVTPATAPTNMAGEVRVSWTLGDAVGLQSVVASVAEGPNAVFTANALGTPAEIAVVAGADQQTAVATAVTVPPEVLVTDAGGAPLSGIPVIFTTERGATVANSQVHTDAQGRADPGAWTLGTSTGVYRLTASVEGDGIEGNPLHIEAVALSGPVAGLVAVEGGGQQAEIAIPVRIAPRVKVEDLYGNPAAGVRVAFSATGDSEVIPAETRTDSAGFAAVDRWTLGITVGTTYSLTASVTTADRTTATVTFTAEATPSVYDIEIVHVSSSVLTDSQREAFEKAEQFWERAITGNLRWTTMRRPDLEECLARNDIAEDVPGDRVVDDLLIYVQIKEIDGPAGVFGGAGPCQIRVNNSLPAVGVMYFDLGDMARLETNGHLEGTILHEMAHVIGFGDPLGPPWPPAGPGQARRQRKHPLHRRGGDRGLRQDPRRQIHGQRSRSGAEPGRGGRVERALARAGLPVRTHDPLPRPRPQSAERRQHRVAGGYRIPGGRLQRRGRVRAAAAVVCGGGGRGQGGDGRGPRGDGRGRSGGRGGRSGAGGGSSGRDRPRKGNPDDAAGGRGPGRQRGAALDAAGALIRRRSLSPRRAAPDSWWPAPFIYAFSPPPALQAPGFLERNSASIAPTPRAVTRHFSAEA